MSIIDHYLEEANRNISALCVAIEKYQALTVQFHGYNNDPIDLDAEGCFV